MTLTEFLLARIAEDEADARAAVSPEHPGTQWTWSRDDDDGVLPVFTLRTEEEFATTSGVGDLPAYPIGYEPQVEKPDALAHIARHDPARVLAECEAKRRIVEMFVERDAQDHLAVHAHATGLLLAIKALAAVFADHPDYREEWRP